MTKKIFLDHRKVLTMDVVESDADATCGAHVYTVGKGFAHMPYTMLVVAGGLGAFAHCSTIASST